MALRRIGNVPMQFLKGKDGRDGKDGVGLQGPAGKDGMDGIGTKGDKGRDGIDGKTTVEHIFQDLPSDLVTKEQLELFKIRIERELDMIKMASSSGSGGGGSASVEQTNDLQRQLDDLVAALDKLIDTDGAFIYIGEAEPGSLTSEAKWRIKRVEDKGGDDLDIRHADGVNTFTKVWDDRLTFTY